MRISQPLVSYCLRLLEVVLVSIIALGVVVLLYLAQCTAHEPPIAEAIVCVGMQVTFILVRGGWRQARAAGCVVCGAILAVGLCPEYSFRGHGAMDGLFEVEASHGGMFLFATLGGGAGYTIHEMWQLIAFPQPSTHPSMREAESGTARSGWDDSTGVR